MSCIAALQDYARFFDTIHDGTQPHPLVFSEPGCTGILRTPYSAIAPLEGGPVGSVYVPKGWTIVMSRNGFTNDQCTVASACLTHVASLGSLISTNTASLTYADGSPGNQIAAIRFRPPVKTDLDWTVEACTGQTFPFIGNALLKTYVPGTPECDTAMTQFCAARPESPHCVCLVDEAKLAADYGANAAQLPVACFGKNCSSYGYKWRRMRQQSCTVTLCEQQLRLTGDSVVSGKQELYCGNRPLSDYKDRTAVTQTSVVQRTSTLSTPADSPGAVTLTLGYWIVIFAAVAVVFTLIPFIIIVMSRMHKIGDA